MTGVDDDGGLYDPFFFARQEATVAAMAVRRVRNEDAANMKKIVLGGRVYLILYRYILHMLDLFHLRITTPPCFFVSFC